MKKLSLLIVFSLIVSQAALSQVVKVVDEENREPLSGVNIYTPDRKIATVTDVQGNADLGKFKGRDRIIFSFVGFTQKTLSYEELAGQEFRVILQPKPLSMGQMVVSASRWQENSREIPAKVTRVEPAQVHLQNPQTAADMVGLSNEVFIQKSQLGGGSPMIRGFATNRVLLVIDGVRMNNAIFRSGNLQNVISLDPNTISNTEVIFGPGSVLYGSDAIGGVMSFNTRKPQLGGEEAEITARALSRFSTANEEKTAHVEFGLGYEKLAFLSSFTVSDYGHQRMGSNGPDEYLRRDYVQRSGGEDLVLPNLDPKVQRPTAYNQYNLMQKVRYRPTSDWDLEAAVHYSTTSDIPRYDRLIERVEANAFRNAEWYYGPQKWLMANLQATWFHKAGLFDQVRLVSAYQHYEESRHDRGFEEVLMRHRIENVQAYSANIDFEKMFEEDITLVYGLEGVWNWVNSRAHSENILTGATRPTATRYPDGSTWQSYALYANYKNNLSERWTVTAGARYNQFLIHAPFEERCFEDSCIEFPFEEANINNGALTGSLGAVYRPNESWQLNANLSTGFRAPNIDDIGKIFDSEPGSVIVPNPGLKAEHAYNSDLGLAKSFGDFLKVDVTFFYTWLDNAMARRDYSFNGREQIIYDGELSDVQALQNVSSARIWGIQGGIEALLHPTLKLTSRINFQDGEERNEDGEYVPVRHVAPTFGSTHLKYEKGDWKVDLYADYNGEIPYSELALSERGKPHLYAKDENGNPHSPSWYTLNLKASYQLLDELDITAGFENITDQRYRQYSSGIAGPGQNFIFSVRGSI